MSEREARDAAAPAAALAQDWCDGPVPEALARRFAGIAADDIDAVARAAHDVLGDDRWATELLSPFVAALASDPLHQPPLAVRRDALRTSVVLWECPLVSFGATVLSVDALAAQPPATTVVVPGRLTLVRYVRAGGARLRLWHAPVCDETFSAASAGRCAPAGSLPLGDGVVLRLDGRYRAWTIEPGTADIVTLTATVRPGAAPVAREYDAGTGAFVRAATLDEGAARAQMLLTLLRVTGRADAGDRFEAATRDPAFFLRWAAMREWLALDLPAALPRLGAMAGYDPHPEVRAAAAATLALVAGVPVEARCHA